jgi:hypothetical protein
LPPKRPTSSQPYRAFAATPHAAKTDLPNITGVLRTGSAPTPFGAKNAHIAAADAGLRAPTGTSNINKIALA